MSNQGKYVRNTTDCPPSDDDVCDQIGKQIVDVGHTEENEAPRMIRNNTDGYSDNMESGSDSDDENEAYSNNESSSTAYSTRSPSASPPVAEVTPPKVPNLTAHEQANADRIDRMEKMLENMNNALACFQANSGPIPNDDTDKSWKFPTDAERRGGESSSSSIRWDHLKPFPSGIAANKMWEHWNRYIENYEIAASLSNVNDPVKRTQLLYLSMGDELQGIVKAAKLRPSLSSPNCYTTFLTNIQKYLRSMTDTAAEHEAFSRMKQGNEESAVAFHARLMCKVRSCNYSVDDEDRFVRSQLLTGLRNRELVKQARTYGHDTNFIVQSATRDEAFESETKQQEEPRLLAIRSYQNRPPYNQSSRKRTNIAGTAGRASGLPAKRQHTDESNQQRSQRQRQRCPRCLLLHHRNGQCPALSRNCNECGKRGHYAAACRQKQVNAMERRTNFDRLPRKHDTPDDNKQEDEQVFSD
ncbi:uncharacterized protein LOC134205738 [Armigeres subalbatus]|uniref:uncharacterized protein LOC134205738 n=1 Tax=Armigeres subalbatus TaxID=124917 RepID=UPI002ED6B4B4